VARRAYAKRYSQAIFEIALETGELDKWQSDLPKIVSIVGEATFKAFLESPKVHFDSKARLLFEQLEDISPLALNLVLLLITKGRLSMLSDIVDEYQRLLDSYRGIESADIITAIPLDERDELKLAEHLSAIVGKKVVIKSEVDPALIGGIIAKIGGKLLDGSTRGKLVALKKGLVSAGR